MNGNRWFVTSLLAGALSISGCSYQSSVATRGQDYGDYFTLSAVKSDVLVLSAKVNSAENSAMLSTAARGKAALVGKSMGYTSFQVIDEAGAEFNSINLSAYGSRLNSESATGLWSESKSIWNNLWGGNNHSNWYDYQLDTPDQHTSSWGGTPLLAENGYRYRLVIRFFRGNNSMNLANVYDIDELLQTQRLYQRRGTYNPLWIETVDRR